MAIKYNTDVHKLSKNEMKVYHELQKILNKETGYKYFNWFIFIW